MGNVKLTLWEKNLWLNN